MGIYGGKDVVYADAPPFALVSRIIRDTFRSSFAACLSRQDDVLFFPKKDYGRYVEFVLRMDGTTQTQCCGEKHPVSFFIVAEF